MPAPRASRHRHSVGGYAADQVAPVHLTRARGAAGDPCVEAIAGTARTLNERREAWLNPPGASAADLKRHTLTNLYNERPAWPAHAHAALDRAV